ncbi:MAG: DNA repair protein RecN [Spirochaetia bacterium]|jgi:DNA repair protein RecN (Recombination protein N)|nr:DNA repair protein RecN [Spirochaetia bacterium]
MLERLSVRDFALIDQAEVDFSSGLVIFTGETGAGKSLIVGAIGFLFGGRGDASIIREGADECLVSGIVDIRSVAPAKQWLLERDLSEEDECVVLRRGLRRQGRAYAYIQNKAVSRTDLAEFCSFLADIHGQHEHQGLLNRSSHLGLLDGFGDLEYEREAYRLFYEDWVFKLKNYRLKMAEAAGRDREKDILEYTASEIGAAKLKPNEDEELEAEERRLSGYEKLFEAVNAAADGLSSGMSETVGGGITALKRASTALGQAAEIDENLKEHLLRLQTSLIDIEDIGQSLAVYREGLRFDPRRLEAIESRLAEIKRLKKKYGPRLEDVISRGNSAAASVQAFDSWDEDKKTLEAEIATSQKKALAQAELLSAKRTAISSEFSYKVESILGKLGMPRAKLPMVIRSLRSESGKLVLSSSGKDELEILIAPNPGESPKPLASIASGGELSRVALAIKAVLSAKGNLSTLIFDEVDAGIGGEVAVAVGGYLKTLARYCQVLCVTHLASIAVKADLHYKVDKIEESGRTVTRIVKLEGAAREGEIARMLAGDKEGKTSLAHASELLKNATL